MRWCAPALVGLVLAASAVAPAAQSGAQMPVCDMRTAERIVAVGDIHGAHDQFRAILRAARLIDDRDRWSGGRAILVQTGDIFDRGDQSRKTLDLLRRLERDARGAGGQVVALLGNHEVMRLVGDWRYVSPGEFNAFRNADSIEFRDNVREQSAAREAERARADRRPFDAAKFREDFMKEVPLGFLEMRLAFMANGEYGGWIRSRPPVARINGVVFLHGGISPEVAQLGCAGINAAIAKELRSLPTAPVDIAALLASRETGPLWYRGLSNHAEADFGPELAGILTRMSARAIVVGHTPVVGKITPRFGGRVLQIDTGMLGGTFYPGGVPSALEIVGDTLTAIYLDRREPLGTLAAAP